MDTIDPERVRIIHYTVSPVQTRLAVGSLNRRQKFYDYKGVRNPRALIVAVLLLIIPRHSSIRIPSKTHQHIYLSLQNENAVTRTSGMGHLHGCRLKM